MSDTADPAKMTPEERLTEVAAILAHGILRLLTRRGGAPGSAGRRRDRRWSCSPSSSVSLEGSADFL